MAQPRLLISKRALLENLESLILESGNKAAIPILKANAYGLGLAEIAGIFNEVPESKLPYFGLARMYEVQQARLLRLKRPLLLLSEWPDLKSPFLDGVDLMVCSFRNLEELLASEKKINFHLKFNSGMNRLGLSLSELLEDDQQKDKLKKLLLQLKLKGCVCVGVSSHLACGDLEVEKFSLLQMKTFLNGVALLKDLLGALPQWVHLENSPAVLRNLAKDQEIVNIFRPGIHLLGVKSDIKSSLISPVVRLQAPLRQLYWIEEGDSVGYNRQFIAKEKTYIGIVNYGYADGLRRSSWKSSLAFYYKNFKLPFLGVVSMDLCAVDCTELAREASFQEGIILEWIGPHQSIESIAEEWDTIPYEVLTSISSRVERVIDL
jgi:alanine racemase